jgi:adenylosuccinate synthase
LNVAGCGGAHGARCPFLMLLPFSSQLIADVGISLGDEGKGRLIPEITHELAGTSAAVSTVLKVNGGANSGHTAAGVKLNLLPCGVVEKEIAHLVIGSGVVADPRKIWWEATPLEHKGYAVTSRLLIDERTLVSDLTHRLLDLAWEDYRVNVLQEEARGSTGRGITPAYGDEVGQWQIWYSDFQAGPNYFARKLAQRVERALRTIQHVCQVMRRRGMASSTNCPPPNCAPMMRRSTRAVHPGGV